MKKLICVILTLVMALSLAACGGVEPASVSTDGSTSMQKVISAAMKMITDMERIGDHCTNIAEWAEFSVTGIHKDCQ